MLGWDRHAERWIVAHRVASLDPVFRGLGYAGTEGAIWLAIGAVLALATGRRRALVWVAIADFVAQIVVPILQAVFHRARPHVHTLVAEPHGHSFPSGHATSSVACAIVLASFAPRLRYVLFLLAAAIAFSRLYVGVHYPLDVLGGVALGFAIGLATRALASRDLRGSTDLRRLAGGLRRSRRGRRAG